MNQGVLIDVTDGVLDVTINRPQARNAMTKAAAEAIARAMDRLEAETELRCAILTGAGCYRTHWRWSWCSRASRSMQDAP